nr:unnamed protein product [Callosobruchus analis]
MKAHFTRMEQPTGIIFIIMQQLVLTTLQHIVKFGARSVLTFDEIEVISNYDVQFAKNIQQQQQEQLQDLPSPPASPKKQGFSQGSGLRNIAEGSSRAAKDAVNNQDAAGHQAAYVAKNTLAQSAAAILSQKLDAYDLRGKINEWICSYLSNRKLMVNIGNELSEGRYLDLGVPQGSILGPLQFSLYMNDLSSYIGDGKVFMYSDDTTILVSARNEAAPLKRLNMLQHS